MRDVTDSVAQRQPTTFDKAFIHLMYWVFRLNPLNSRIWTNALTCEHLAQTMPSISPAKLRYGPKTMVQAAQELVEQAGFSQVILAGNQVEQKEFLAVYHPKNLIRLDPSNNTLDQAQKIAPLAMGETRSQTVQLLTFVPHSTRVFLTLIKQMGKCGRGGWIPLILPSAYLDSEIVEMDKVRKMTGILSEARKLWKYQKKGDVATWEEALKYIARLSVTEKTTSPDILCIVF